MHSLKKAVCDEIHMLERPSFREEIELPQNVSKLEHFLMMFNKGVYEG